MNTPDEFLQLCRLYYPGSRLEYKTKEEWLESGISGLSDKRKRVIKSFLTELLDGGYSEQRLQQVWRSTRPSYQFAGDGAMRYTFTFMRDAICRSSRLS